MKSHLLLQHLEKLRGFAAVARARGLHKAARELGLSQPALSRSVAALESILGKKLFVRSVRGVELTSEGQALLLFYDKIEGAVGDLVQKLSAGPGLAGDLRIASYETLCTYLWPDFLKRLAGKQPDLKITLITSNEAEHWARLAAGAIDAIVDAEPRVGLGWESHVLYSDRFNFYVSRQYSGDALDLIYVDRAYDEDGMTIRDHCVKNGLVFRDQHKLDTFISVRAFTLNGLGVGVLPERLATPDVESGRLRKLPVRDMPTRGFGKHRICFSVSTAGRFDPRLSLLRRELRSHFSR